MGQPKRQNQPSPLAVLDDEPWGWQMKRARENHAGLTMDQAVVAIGRYHLTSKAAISRMEASAEAPTDKRRRALACVAAIVYGLNPSQFGVGSDDLPPGTVSQILRGLSRDSRSTRWYGGRVVGLWERRTRPDRRRAA